MNEPRILSQSEIDKYFPSLHPLKGDDPKFIEEEKKAERERRIGKYFSAGFPEKYNHVALESLNDEQKEIGKKFLNEIIQDKPASIWLCGSAGTGKTCLSCAIAKETSILGKSVKYVKSHLIIERLKKNQISITDLLYDLQQNFLIVIDEVGRYPLTEWESYYLFLIMDELYNRGRSVIMISNLEKNKLGELLGNACVDRFKGSTTSYEFNGKSYRGSKGELYV